MMDSIAIAIIYCNYNSYHNLYLQSSLTLVLIKELYNNEAIATLLVGSAAATSIGQHQRLDPSYSPTLVVLMMMVVI